MVEGGALAKHAPEANPKTEIIFARLLWVEWRVPFEATC